MIIKNNLKLKTIHNGGLTFRFLETGDIYDITYQDYQINLLKGNALDGSLMNVYLRTKIDGSYVSTALISRDVLTHVEFLEHKVMYKGRFHDINFQLDLVIDKFQWDIHVYLDSNKKVEKLLIDLIDCRELQRLRWVRQLGTSWLTFHGAEATRFPHSLGSMHVANLMFEKLSRNLNLEKEFVVVHWEQRGAGNSYKKNPKPKNLSLEQITSSNS